jgi:hypothetical protein
MSLITIEHQPPSFQPVLTNGLFYTVSADTTDKFKFRYTYNVYANDELVFQAKTTPNPYNLGVVDISSILKNFCENTPISLWDETPIYTHQTFPFSRPNTNEVVNYQVYFGFEYASTELGSVTGFTGVSGLTGLTIGDPAVSTPRKKTFHSTMGVNGRATQQDFNMTQFVLSGTPNGVNPSTSGLFLTNSPRYRNIQESEYYTLAFTNYYLDETTLSEPYYVEYKFYDESNNLITGVTFDNIVSNGGGPRTDCNNVYQQLPIIIPSGNTNFNTLYVGAGPMNLEPIMPVNATHYTVQLFGKFTGTTSPIQPTPTPTPTPTATPQGACDCYEIQVTNNSFESQGIVYYLDCNRVLTTLVVSEGLTLFFCTCSADSYSYEGPLTFTNNGLCNLTPSPTPTRTPTPTPTPSMGSTPHTIFECSNNGCSEGTCFCDDPTSITVYSMTGVAPGDVGQTLYTDAGLTTVFNGTYQYLSFIYNASPINPVCPVGGPC